MDRCRSCGAEIIWVKMPSGKSMPIDAEPHSDGTVFVHSDGDRAAVLTPAERLELGVKDQPCYRSHFASCPNASKHRKK